MDAQWNGLLCSKKLRIRSIPGSIMSVGESRRIVHRFAIGERGRHQSQDFRGFRERYGVRWLECSIGVAADNVILNGIADEWGVPGIRILILERKGMCIAGRMPLRGKQG